MSSKSTVAKVIRLKAELPFKMIIQSPHPPAFSWCPVWLDPFIWESQAQLLVRSPTPTLLAEEVTPDLRDSSFVLEEVHVTQHPCQAHSRVAAGTVVHCGNWKQLKWWEKGGKAHIKGLLPGAKHHVLIAKCSESQQGRWRPRAAQRADKAFSGKDKWKRKDKW